MVLAVSLNIASCVFIATQNQVSGQNGWTNLDTSTIRQLTPETTAIATKV